MEQWEAGAFEGETDHVTAVANAQARGQLHFMKMLIDLDAEQLYEALHDDE